MQQTTILRVTKNNNGRNVWKIERCDCDSSFVGEITICGVPAPAKDLPVGTEYKTVLTIPNL